MRPALPVSTGLGASNGGDHGDGNDGPGGGRKCRKARYKRGRRDGAGAHNADSGGAACASIDCADHKPSEPVRGRLRHLTPVQRRSAPAAWTPHCRLRPPWHQDQWQIRQPNSKPCSFQPPNWACLPCCKPARRCCRNKGFPKGTVITPRHWPLTYLDTLRPLEQNSQAQDWFHPPDDRAMPARKSNSCGGFLAAVTLY
jgi:hypothetical protein